ncbi:sugar phosphate nucleotidyltransferase [Desulfobacca acetoxidans]|uniref:Mannose-1-phosphate guanylyltransferase n=1 Tax=Desulfobacca acetoxidans (strain ATCC 700848 / DSM 11109 / ASRB2) TaxID=880072 RepID=F2NIJ6_DESAR|nr:sugar phosphate nucleotidyltransferase [Desulfobacca acetoxidans]AEB10471.1 Mannose-1-phosphate guanylyltransferase [Desulfobacca acetoxidans DSM 11109]HAY21601.1 nucleoside-diphosphate-sugar pyrophosphorylase [Desulfobacterales bacterium]
MRAVILAGGKGIRLAPLTEVFPKPLVPVGGMPIMEIVIRQLKFHGFTRITLAVGYLADLIQAYFQDGSKWGVSITYSREATPLGTAGPLALIDDLNETFLVMNADVLTSLDYLDLINFHRSHGGIATIGTNKKHVKIDLGVIVTNGLHTIQDYIEKPTTDYQVSMGVYIFEPRVLDFIRGKGYLDFPDLVKTLLKAGLPIKSYPFQGYWMDIGRHDDYAQASEEFLQMKDVVLPGLQCETSSS